MAELCVPEMGSACILYLVGDGMANGRIAVIKHVEVERLALLEGLARDAFTAPEGRQSLLEAVFTRRPVLLSQLQTADLIGDGRPAHILQCDLHIKTAVLIPVVNEENVLGVAVFLAYSAHWYTPHLVCIASELCDRFARAVTTAQMYTVCKMTLESTREFLSLAMSALVATNCEMPSSRAGSNPEQAHL
jgi:hypothetical protein